MVLRMLLEVTIYSSILFLVILLFRKIFKKHASPAMLYAAWLLLIARLVIPFTVGGVSLIVLPAEQTVVQQPQSGLSAPVEDTAGTYISYQKPGAVVEAPAAEPDAVQAGVQPEDNAVPVAHAVSREWDWETALTMLWIAGAGIVLLNMAVAKTKLYIQLASAPRLPDKWQEAALRIQNELGVHSRVRFVAMRDFTSPALSASLRPTIVIPMSLLWESGQSIEFSLRHELTHLKRRDHFVCLLLMLLKAVYWFNPVIWLFARLMKMDMETACDSRVVSAMGGTEKRQYATTVIDMYAQTKPRFMLGMALGHTRQIAEQRVRGIYMRQRSARGIKAAALLLAAVMLIACFTTALQPVRAAGSERINTPEQSAAEIGQEPKSSQPASTPRPERAATPNLSELQQRSRSISGNISANDVTFAVRKDGTVLQAGRNRDYGEFDVSEWSDIVAVSSGYQQAIGLRSDGTVVVTGGAGGLDTYLYEQIKEWKDITAVAAGGNSVVMGLKSDGTVVESGITYDSTDPNKVKNWRDIVAIAAGEEFGVGLRADGTVVAAGKNSDGQCDVGDWSDIVAISASEMNVVGLKSDGTVVATGFNYDGRCNVQQWRDIIAVACGGYCTFGLKADGTVVYAGDNYLGQGNTQDWKDIIAISAGSGHTVGLKADGTMVAVGANMYGECEVEDWTDIATERLK